MKAFQVAQHAHPSKIQTIKDVDAPTPKKNEILIDVYAAGLNFFDILQSQGKYQNQPPLPFVLGTEFSGRIAASSPIPKGCTFKPGDKVFGAAQGAFAEKVVADWRACLPVPKGLSWEEAAGMYITYPTSYEALKYRARAQPGEWVLVHAGAGGVGLAACQIAKALGCKVIATASTESKRQVCLDHGHADHAIPYADAKTWQAEVLAITGNRGVDVVYDPVGMLIQSLKVAAWKARLLVVGFAAGSIERVPANLVLLKNVELVGVHWGAYMKKEPSHPVQVWKELFELLEQKKLKPAVYDRVYEGLEEVRVGLGELEGRKTWGKGVVRVRADDEKEKAKL